jgi:hypothetical protein
MNRMQAWPSGRRHQIANLAGHPHRRFESARLLQWQAQAQRRVRRTCKPSGLLCKLFGWPRPVAPARRPWNVIHLDYGGGSGGTTTVCYTTSSYFTRTVTTAMNSSMTNEVWYNAWNGGTATTNSITSPFNDGMDGTWQTWIATNRIFTASGTGPAYFRATPDRRTPEQIAQEQEQMRIAAERQAAAVREAEGKARALLESVLNPDELTAFKRDGHLIVHGRSGRRYRLRQGRVANIDVIHRDGRILHRLCAHPDRTMPALDIMLAQKLWLETDEHEFVSRANVHGLIHPAEQVLEPL